MMARKGDWIQSQHSECIPTWSLEACLYFLSLSESVKRNLPGSVKFTQVKEAIGTRIYQIIEEQQQQQQQLQQQHIYMLDYLFLADTLNSIFFVLYLLYPETVVPPIPNTSIKAIKEAILVAHSLLKVGFPNSQNNDNNKTSGDEENTPEPIPEPPPPPTQPPPPATQLRKRHQLIELVASEVNIACKWTLDMCIDFLLLSEPYQSKCLLKGQHLKGVKDLVCYRIHSIFKETVISTSLSLTSSSSADGDDQAGLDDAHFRSVVVETINILVQNIRQNHDRDPSYSLGSFPTVTEQDLTSVLHSSTSSTTTNTTGNRDLSNADNNLCILNFKLRHAVQLLQQKYKSLHPT